MARIAVAGGTGDVGRTIVEALVNAGKHQVFVLGRKAPTTPGPGDAEGVVVDYNDVDGLTKVLDSKSVDTVISALTMEGPGAESQQNLIAAAGKALTTKRFIPSDFSAFAPDETEDAAADGYTAATRLAVDAIRKNRLTYTLIANGLFMDYFGQPHVPSYLRPFKWAVDIPGRRAAIPGTGDEIVTLTYSKDVARFVARLVEEEEWPEYSIIAGSDVSLNQIVALVEKALGAKIDVVRDNLEDLKAGKATDLFPSGEETYGGMDSMAIAAYMGTAVAEGKTALPKEGRLNDRFPEIKVKTISELVAEAWTGK